MSKHATREEWLTAAMAKLTPLFKSQPVPKKVRVSCGFPSKNALGEKLRRIGECWADSASQGKFFEIFISPVLSKPVDVLAVLAHEMVHSVVGLECGHKQPFKKVATEIGLVGPMRATSAGPELKKQLANLAKELGEYPHHKLDKTMTNGKKPDKCRMIKAECPDCGYIIRVTQKWLDVGLPTCCCGEEFTTEAGEEDE